MTRRKLVGVSFVMALVELLILVAGSQQQPTSLYDTPEWLRFHELLSRASAYHVRLTRRTSFGTSRLPAWSELWMDKSRKFVLDLPKERVYWDGKTATSVDRASNEFTRDGREPRLGLFAWLGMDVPGGKLEAAPTLLLERLSKDMVIRSSHLPSTSGGEVGWRFREQGIDTYATVEYWFDKTTHLPTSVIAEGGGMGGRWHCSFDLEWRLEPVLPEDHFKPKGLSSNELSPPRFQKHYDVIALRPPKVGEGKLRLDIPASAVGSVGVRTADGRVKLMARGVSKGVEADLEPGRYVVELGGSVMAVSILEGYATVIKVGAVQSKSGQLVSKPSDFSNAIHTEQIGKEPIAVFADTYRWKVDGKFKKVVVAPGKIVKI